MQIKTTGASQSQAALVAAFAQLHSGVDASVDLELGVSTAMTRETFSLRASRGAGEIRARLEVSDDNAVRWGLNALRRWLATDAAELELSDRPAFRWRGVIEGFYGTPWSHEQRLRAVEHFGDFGMNLFLVAPKDAQWQRFAWREPLSVDFMAALSELIARGSEHAVDVSACVSPGLSVTYSDDADVAAVIAKFKQMHDVGARHFGLLLDDIPDTLTVPADIERYGNIAKAHADFANRVREGLAAIDPHAHVILCPMHYAGRGTEPYLQVMGDELHPQIDLMWTGRDICSSYLDIADAVVFERTTRRPPFYWDNYPVNDGSMIRRLHIGPIEGREAGLERYSAGLLANPMEFFEASLLPLGTIGDYLWDSRGYDAWASWERVLTDLVPVEADRLAIRDLFRNSLGLGGGWSPAFNAVLAECSKAWRSGDVAGASLAARRYAIEIAANSQQIRADSFCAPLLRADIAPWLDKYELGGLLLAEFAGVVAQLEPVQGQGLRGRADLREELVAIRKRFNDNQQRLFGDGYDQMFAELIAETDFR